MEPKLKRLYSDSTTPAEYVRGFTLLMADLVRGMDRDKIALAIDWVEQAASLGRTIHTLANGGSAAVASHFVNDMGVNSIVQGKPGYRVVSLVDNVESITAVANDSGYDNVFLFQLQCTLAPTDVVIAMSVSGNSENVIRAVDYANSEGARTIGLCGFDGGRLAEVAQLAIHLPSSPDEYGPVEDGFSIICHIISGFLTMKRGRPLHH